MSASLDDAVPLLERARCRRFDDQNWIAPTHKVPRPKRRVPDNIAYLVEAHHRPSQCRHVGSRRRAFLPTSAFEVVIDDVTAIGAFSGQKVLERAAPNRRHEPIFAENCQGLFGIEPGAAASRQQMMGVDLIKAIALLDAREP